jgi:hypothetical protein
LLTCRFCIKHILGGRDVKGPVEVAVGPCAVSDVILSNWSLVKSYTLSNWSGILDGHVNVILLPTIVLLHSVVDKHV